MADRYADVETYLIEFEESAATAVENGWLLQADADTMREEELARAQELLGG